MNVRSLFVCSALLLFTSAAYASGSYQRTKDGQTFVWNDSPEAGKEATWSGKCDKQGFATGLGILTWYKVEPTIVTGSNILDTRRYVVVTSLSSGKMVRGKFEGVVTSVDENGKTLQVTAVSKANRPVPRRKLPRVRTRGMTAKSTAKQPATSASPEIVAQSLDRTSGPATTQPIQEQSVSPIVQEPVAVAAETPIVAARSLATPPSEQQARLDIRKTTASKPFPSDDSVRSRSERPVDLPKPPRSIDAQTVAKLDTLYQSAVKANDTAIMDEILADDFVLVTDRGNSLTKADLMKEAQEKRTIYEQQDVQEGTQKVRIWRDTAVVTGLLRVKGTRDKNPFDYDVWLSQTYVRTPTGWRYVFGQALKPEAK